MENEQDIKSQQKKAALAARRALTAEERAAASGRICEQLINHVRSMDDRRIRTIFSYAAVWDEANVDAFNDWAESEGITVAFPYCRRGGIMDAMVPANDVCGDAGNPEADARYAETDAGNPEAACPAGSVWRETWLRSGAYGIREPDPERSRILDPQEIDLVIVPCVGFDGNGGRVGHGAGYYDRYLPKLRPDAEIIMVAFEAQRLPAVYMGEMDVRIPVCIT